MTVDRADQLISDLFEDPETFHEQGDAYALLQEFFGGCLTEMLRPFLNHQNVFVRKSAVWVASELGEQALPVVLDVLPLLDSGDRYLAYHAMEVVAVCAVNQAARLFRHIALALETEDNVLRNLAMRLVANARPQTLQQTLEQLKGEDEHRTHADGLTVVLSTKAEEATRAVELLLESDQALLRKYGVILAKRVCRVRPDLILAATSNDDADVRRYAREVVEVHRLG